MHCSSQLLNSPHASSGGTGGGAGGWQSVRSINMKYSALNIHIIYCYYTNSGAAVVLVRKALKKVWRRSTKWGYSMWHTSLG